MALYEIETERLLLRPWREGDWIALHHTYGDPEVMRWIGSSGVGIESTAFAVGRMSMHWRILGYGMFALEGRSTWELIGRVGLTLHPDWPLEGPMTLPNNARSRAVIERCGLTYRGTLEFHGYVQVHYAIDRGDLRHGVELAPMTIREVSA